MVKSIRFGRGCWWVVLFVLLGQVGCDKDVKADNFLFTYWGPLIDAGWVTDEVWHEYLDYCNQLRDIGATHVGIAVWSISPSPQTRKLIATRVNDLREGGFSIALHQSSGRQILLDDDELDLRRHKSNGRNLKYFDSMGFDPRVCAPRFPCPNRPSRHAHDPAYGGSVWQKELDFLTDLLGRVGIGSHDLVLLDVEVWGAKLSYLHAVYPGVLEASVVRYSGTLPEREEQYFGYWSQRGRDLRNIVKQRNSGTRLYFYNENVPELERENTRMPGRVGDAPSPSYYYAPNLDRFREELDKGDFSGTYPWISFSTTNYHWVNPPGEHPSRGPVSLRWDPKVTQKAGYLLRQEGVAGAIIYPAPGHHDVPVDYYMEHAQAWVDGFVNGIDPGELVEICGDDWDNDGDGEWNEGCPQSE